MSIQDLTEFFKWWTIISGCVYVFSVVMILLFREMAFRMHAKMFGITREAFNIAVYSYVALFKLVFIVFNLIPYLALELIG